jgi:hypothetical protein
MSKFGAPKSRGRAGLLSSGVKTQDTQIKSGGGLVHWVTLSATAASVVGLADAVGNSTTYVEKFTLPSDGYAHYILDPPLEFATGIWLDVVSGTCDVIVGYI